MARASRESLYETGIFPIPWGTPDLAINHEEPEKTRPLAVENAKLMTRIHQHPRHREEFSPYHSDSGRIIAYATGVLSL